MLPVRRANYQAAVWRQALCNTFQLPSPHGHGWVVKNTKLKVESMNQPAAPAALLELRTPVCVAVQQAVLPEGASAGQAYFSALMHASARTAGSDSETSAPQYD